MKNRLNKLFAGIVATGMLLGSVGPGFAGESLYEYYTDTPIDTLKQETREISQELKDVFGQNSLVESQQEIDFAEYFSNLRRMVVYAVKMASYSEYEKDLRFARDHEVFKGLPEEIEPRGTGEPPLDRKEFAKNKFVRLTENITEELETYKDLVQLALDACETLANNDLSEFIDNDRNQLKVRQFNRGNTYKAYLEGKERFSKRWPDLAARLASQLTLWEEKSLSSDSPLIDRAITQRL